MHEMSIAEGILDVALDTLRQHDATVIHFCAARFRSYEWGRARFVAFFVGKPLLKELLLKGHVLKSTQFP